MKKIILFSVAILFLFSASSSAQVGVVVKGQGTYGVLLKPDIQEYGLPVEKLTKGGFGFFGQVLYRAGKIISLGVEAGYLRFWKDEYTELGIEYKESLSAMPILGIIQLESPLPLVSPYLQVGVGVYPLTAKLAVLGLTIKDTTAQFGVMAGAGVEIPLAPKLSLDVGGKLHMIFTENESTIMFNPFGGISIRL